MELGKDVLAIDPAGNPCAYQLKGTADGRFRLSDWRDGVQGQMYDLVLGRIVHPSIVGDRPHRSILVVNGMIEEEVQRSIEDFNRERRNDGTNRQLEIIVRGELFSMLRDTAQEFWPPDHRTFFKLHIDPGDGQLPKEEFAKILESAVPLVRQIGDPPRNREATLQLQGAAIVTSLSLNSFVAKQNYVAQFEGWTLLCSYILLAAEKWNLDEYCWRPTIGVALQTMYNLLGNLLEELVSVKNLVVGSPMSDFTVFRIRVTHLVGLMGLYGLWRKHVHESASEVDREIKDFCTRNSSNMLLWGEYALPQFLSYHLFERHIDATARTDVLLYALIEGIEKHNLNTDKSNFGLPNPYYSPEEILPYLHGLTQNRLGDSFVGSSYGLEGLVHLFVRTNRKSQLKFMWPAITRLAVMSFYPKDKWGFYLWRCDDGENIEVYPIGWTAFSHFLGGKIWYGLSCS
jgi:hypothetical protein